MSEKTFSKEAIIQEAFDILEKNLGFLFLLLAISLVIPAIPSLYIMIPFQLHPPANKEELIKAIEKFNELAVLYLPITLTMLTWSYITMAGVFYKIPLNLIRKIPVKLSQMFTNFSTIIRLLLGYLLVGIIVTIGVIFLIAPGVYLAIRFQLFAYLIVDKNLGVIESFKESWRLTEGKVGNLFVLGLILIGISFLYSLFAGIIPLAFGMVSAISSIAKNDQMASILVFSGSLFGLISKIPLYAFIYLLQALVYEKIIGQTDNQKDNNQEAQSLILEK
jgi:uncharacterized membrane protein